MRTFVRDKLGFSFQDVGGGWLIFDLPEANLGIHPSDETRPELSFYCDDIHETVAQLDALGVEFTEGITETVYGLSTHFLMPGDVEVELYQPSHQPS